MNSSDSSSCHPYILLVSGVPNHEALATKPTRSRYLIIGDLDLELHMPYAIAFEPEFLNDFEGSMQICGLCIDSCSEYGSPKRAHIYTFTEVYGPSGICRLPLLRERPLLRHPWRPH